MDASPGLVVLYSRCGDPNARRVAADVDASRGGLVTVRRSVWACRMPPVVDHPVRPLFVDAPLLPTAELPPPPPDVPPPAPAPMPESADVTQQEATCSGLSHHGRASLAEFERAAA